MPEPRERIGIGKAAQICNVFPLEHRSRQPLPLPQSAILAIDVFGFAGPTLADQLFFTLTRRKEGTEVGLKMGKLWWNLSYMTETYPKSFRDARVWVSGYARRYGYDAIELPRRRRHG
jgi:hypothetical protein